MVACHCTFDVRQQLLVPVHHLLVVEQLKIDFDHLLQGLEAPLALLAVLQVQHLLERCERRLRLVVLQCFAVVVLILQVDIRLRIAVLGILLRSS